MQCPVCKETIKDGSIKCPFCGYIIDKAKYKKLKTEIMSAKENGDFLIKCPVCKENIKDGSTKCSFCGYIIDKAAYKNLKSEFMSPKEKKEEEKINAKVKSTPNIFSKLLLWIKPHHRTLATVIFSFIIIETVLALLLLLKNPDYFSGTYIGGIDNDTYKVIINRMPNRGDKKDYFTQMFINKRQTDRIITYWHYNYQTKREYLTLKSDDFDDDKIYITSTGKNYIYLFDEDWESIGELRGIYKKKRAHNNNPKLFLLINIGLLIIGSLILLWWTGLISFSYIGKSTYKGIKNILPLIGKGIYKGIKNILLLIGKFIISIKNIANKGITSILRFLKKINYAKLFLILGIIGIVGVLVYIGLTTEWVKPPVMVVSIEKQKIAPGNPINNRLIMIDEELKKNSDNVKLNLEKAYILRKKGNYKEMIVAAQEVVQKDKKSEKAYYLLGEGYYKQEQYDLAMTNYKKSIKLNKNYEPAYMGLANCYLVYKDINKAEINYLKVIELNDKNAIAYNNLAIINAKNKKSKEAIEDLKKAVEINPDMKKAWLNLGILSEREGEKQNAVEYYQKYLEFDPGNRQVVGWIEQLQEGE